MKAADRFERRAKRTRYALKANGKGRLRLSVFRSGRHIYGQVIDDEQGQTLAAASTLDKDLRGRAQDRRRPRRGAQGRAAAGRACQGRPASRP